MLSLFYINTFVVRRIMFETFTSLVKPSNLAGMFVLTYSLIKNMASLENRPLTYVGTMKMGGYIS